MSEVLIYGAGMSGMVAACNLAKEGFDVTVRMQGLGADEKVQARFVEKVGRALN